jgi:DNA-binding NarL/FixJ family response regulator
MIEIEPSPIRTLVACEFPAIAFGLASLIDGRQPTLASVGVAITLQDAESFFRAGAPDVLVVDIDGDFGAEAVARMAGFSDARVLALSGGNDDAVHDAIIMAGAVGVVGKREPTDVFLHAIESVHAGEVWIDRRAIGRIFQGLSRLSRGEGRHYLDKLTAKERLIVEHLKLSTGATNRTVAERLHISENTLRNHLTSIYAKLGIASRTELHALLSCNGRTPQK